MMKKNMKFSEGLGVKSQLDLTVLFKEVNKNAKLSSLAFITKDILGKYFLNE